jgi:hypothetical protein
VRNQRAIDSRAVPAQDRPHASRVRLKVFYAAEGKGFMRGLSREATCPSKPRRSWKPFTRANEKFHLSPTSQHGNVAEIVGKFGGADLLRNAVIYKSVTQVFAKCG